VSAARFFRGSWPRDTTAGLTASAFHLPLPTHLQPDTARPAALALPLSNCGPRTRDRGPHAARVLFSAPRRKPLWNLSNHVPLSDYRPRTTDQGPGTARASRAVFGAPPKTPLEPVQPRTAFRLPTKDQGPPISHHETHEKHERTTDQGPRTRDRGPHAPRVPFSAPRRKPLWNLSNHVPLSNYRLRTTDQGPPVSHHEAQSKKLKAESRNGPFALILFQLSTFSFSPSRFQLSQFQLFPPASSPFLPSAFDRA